MVLYDYASNRWVKPVIKRHQDAGRAEGREEGISIGHTAGRREASQEWRAWLQRKNAAESQGLPFDEPPPDAES